MNTHRRLLAAFLIVFSCLFTFPLVSAANSHGSGSSSQGCSDTEALPDDVPTWIVVQQQGSADCVASGNSSLCGEVAPLPANFPDWIEKPTCSYVEADNDAAVAADVCTNIGPTVFNLGLGSATFAAAPACLVVGADQDNDSALADTESSATSEEPDVVRGQPHNIGPTI